MTFARTTLAAALLGASSSALALPLNHAFDFELRMSGATAQEEGLVLAMVDLCASAIDVWNIRNHQVVTCVLGPQAGTALNNKAVILRKTGVGGSGNGIGPVFLQTAVPFMTDAAWATCTTTTTVTRTLASGTKTFPSRSGCTITTSPLVPAAGLSDVEPRLFVNEFGAAGTTPGPGDRVVGTSALSFGVIATTTLRNAMQAVQGLVPATVPAGDPTRDDVAVMPSISNAELASILAGNIGLVDQLAGQPNVTVAGGPSPIDIGRRVNTSGSQKIAEVVLLNQGCASDVAGMVVGASTGFGGVITTGSGTGDLIAGLNTANAAGRAGIGFVSTESAPTANIKYLKIDGVSPSIENVINGTYRFFSMNAATIDGSVTGDRATLFDALTVRLSEGFTIRAMNTAFNRGSWQGGFVGGFPAVLAGGTPDLRPVTLTQARANPIFSASKDGFGAGILSNCSTLQFAQ